MRLLAGSVRARFKPAFVGIAALFWAAISASATEPPFVSLPLDPDHWSIAYNGDGNVCFGPEGIRLGPNPPMGLNDSHAALLLSRKTFPATNFELEVEFELIRPLRTPAPHPWETFWLLFQYRPSASARAKKTNYALLKSNGIELGRAWGTTDQSFVLTSDYPRGTSGRTFTLRVRLEEKQVRVYCDGELVGAVPRGALFTHSGHIGLYTEDAAVLIRTVKTRALPRPRPSHTKMRP